MDVILLLILLIILIIYILYTNFTKNYSGSDSRLTRAQYKNNVVKLEVQRKFIELQVRESLLKTKTPSDSNISKEIVEKTLSDLATFEAECAYLSKGITLASLSKKMNTNTAYLSEIINIYKGKILLLT